MRDMRNTAAAALVSAAALSALTGCGTDTTVAGRVRTPQQQLLAAVPGPDAISYGFALTEGETKRSGVLQPASKQGFMQIEQRDAAGALSVTMQFLVRDGHAWSKIAFSKTTPGTGVPSQWMSLDPEKITNKDLLSTVVDPASAKLLIAQASEVTGDGASFRGILDLTKVPEVHIADPGEIAALRDKASRIPFTAAVDAGNHLSTLSIAVPAIGARPAYQRVAEYRDFGTAVIPAAPAAKSVVDTPAKVYDLFNS